MTFLLNGPAGGGSFGRVTVSRVTGAPGLGFFRLGVTVDIIVEPAGGSSGAPDLPQLAELLAEVRIAGRPAGRFEPMPGYLPVVSYAARTNEAHIELTCDLDRARIEAIEAARGGRDLALDVWFNGRFGDGQAFSNQEPFVVNQGVWVDVLSQMGYQQTLLIEVPIPSPAAQPELAEAVRLLGEAQGHMVSGHDRDAVGKLRDVLDQVTLAFGDDDENIDPALKSALFQNSRGMDKAERLRVVRRALKLVTHPARHRDQVTAGFSWSRIDSAQMIAMVAAFINEMSAPDARPAQPSATLATPAGQAET